MTDQPTTPDIPDDDSLPPTWDPMDVPIDDADVPVDAAPEG